MSEASPGRVLSISHIQMNCADLKASVAFYRLLDFRVERIIGENPANPADRESLENLPVIRSDMGANRTVGMGISDDPRASTRIELMEWLEPELTTIQTPPMQRYGAARIAFTVKGLEQILERLKAAGYEAESVENFDISPTLSSRFAHVFDPDGNHLTLMEWIKR